MVMGMSALTFNNKGFSLVELMVALVLSGMAMTAIYRGYVSIVVANDVQEDSIELHQSLRVGLNSLVDDLRMAGYNPAYKKPSPTIQATSDANSIDFSADLDPVDDTPSIYDNISYQLDTVNLELERQKNGGGFQVVMANVEALNFVYLDKDRNTIDPPLTSGLVDMIKSVQVAVVARNGNPDYSYSGNGAPYKNKQGDEILSTPDNNYHRRVLLVEVQTRNHH